MIMVSCIYRCTFYVHSFRIDSTQFTWIWTKNGSFMQKVSAKRISFFCTLCANASMSQILNEKKTRSAAATTAACKEITKNQHRLIFFLLFVCLFLTQYRCVLSCMFILLLRSHNKSVCSPQRMRVCRWNAFNFGSFISAQKVFSLFATQIRIVFIF